MTPYERLSLAIHLESAAIAPQTSELIEAAKEALREIERLRAALMPFATMADEVETWQRGGDPVRSFDARDLFAARDLCRIHQQLSVNSEEGK